MTIPDYSRYSPSVIPWPEVIDWLAAELRGYLADAADLASWQLPTRCPPWTVADLTRHLAATFRRFADQLDKARSGDLSPPFGRDELSTENLRAVAEFAGDPLQTLDSQARRFLAAAAAGDAADLMGHQFGPIPVGLQVMFGLNELAVHHDDLAAAAGRGYQPPGPVISALTDMMTRSGRMAPGQAGWQGLLVSTGR